MYFELILSILASSLLLNIFRYFEKYNVVTLNAIVANYVIAGSLSFIVQGEPITKANSIDQPWFGLAVVLGLIFIALFNLMAYSSQKLGVASTSIANKITFVIPTALWILLYNEEYSWIKILGIFIALLAIFLTGEKSGNQSEKKSFILILALFLGGGLLDTLLSYGQQELVPPEKTSVFFGYLFGFAFLFGLGYMVFQRKNNHPWPSKKDILWGVILGIPNYFSMFFFLKSLEKIPTSTAFPVANMGVILGSTILSMILFKETLSKRKTIALVSAVGAIALISFHETLIGLFNG